MPHLNRLGLAFNLIVIVAVSICVPNLTVAAQDQVLLRDSCLQEQWPRLPDPPSPEQKLFDVKNDMHKSGFSISCRMALTATEVQSFILLFKESVALGDFEEISSRAIFPLAIYKQGHEETEERLLEAESIVLSSPAELQEFFESQIDYYREVAGCTDLHNVHLDPTWGFSIGDRAVWFGRTLEDRQIRILSLHSRRMPIRDCGEDSSITTAAYKSIGCDYSGGGRDSFLATWFQTRN